MGRWANQTTNIANTGTVERSPFSSGLALSSFSLICRLLICQFKENHITAPSTAKTRRLQQNVPLVYKWEQKQTTLNRLCYARALKWSETRLYYQGRTEMVKFDKLDWEGNPTARKTSYGAKLELY